MFHGKLLDGKEPGVEEVLMFRGRGGLSGLLEVCYIGVMRGRGYVVASRCKVDPLGERSLMCVGGLCGRWSIMVKYKDLQSTDVCLKSLGRGWSDSKWGRVKGHSVRAVG